MNDIARTELMDWHDEMRERECDARLSLQEDKMIHHDPLPRPFEKNDKERLTEVLAELASALESQAAARERRKHIIENYETALPTCVKLIDEVCETIHQLDAELRELVLRIYGTKGKDEGPAGTETPPG